MAVFPLTEGRRTDLVPIDLYAPPEKRDHRVPEHGKFYIPDFQRYWGVCHLDRRYRMVSVENQEIKALNGQYIKDLLGIRQV